MASQWLSVAFDAATAVASHFLGINPFDQPNVEAAKIKAREIVAEYAKTGSLPAGEFAALEPGALGAFLQEARPGDYIAIQAYIPATRAADAALQSLRPVSYTHLTLPTSDLV